MKYFYYSSKEPVIPGWIVTDTKARHSDLCGKGIKGFCLAVRVWLWYLGVPARIAFRKYKNTKKIKIKEYGSSEDTSG